jgi:peptidoglycan hydrolase-like protein with peptidoglycan-binding domain
VRAEPQAEGAPLSANAPATLVRDVQSALAARGYQPGAADGDAGPITRAAILAFEHDYGLAATAEASDALLAALRAAGRPVAGGAHWQKPTEAASNLMRNVQQHLIATGYLKGQPTGVPDAPTIAAIRAFETVHRLAVTGRISAPLMARLQQNRARVAVGQ